MKASFYQRGITAIEILLVVSILILIAIVTVPSFISFRNNQALQNTTNSIVSLLQEARTKTLGSYNNTFYSVYIDTESATLFTGGTYSSGDTTNKIVPYESPVVLQSVTLSGGGTKISFDRLKGTTSQGGTIIVGIPGGASKTISVSASGVISRD